MGGGIQNRFFNIDKSVQCKDLVIKTQLFSPVPEVIEKIEIGDILRLRLETASGPCLAIYNEEVAGTIISKSLLQLIECMNKKVKFIAVVRGITGGTCSITIKAS